MLNIFFGDMEKPAAYGPSWFKYSYDPVWFEDLFVQRMIRDIDKSEFLSGRIIDSPFLGHIPPEKLSGGVQTLIMIYEKPEIIFDATSCGPNCAEYLLEIGEKKDITVNLNYLMPFKNLEPFEIRILNAGIVVHSSKEYVRAALDYV